MNKKIFIIACLSLFILFPTSAYAKKINLNTAILTLKNPDILQTNYREYIALPFTYSTSKSSISKSSEIKVGYKKSKTNLKYSILVNNSTIKSTFKKNLTYNSGNFSIAKAPNNSIKIDINLEEEVDLETYTVTKKTISSGNNYIFTTYLMIKIEQKDASTEDTADITIDSDDYSYLKSKILVVVDAGHGGKDSGACGNSLKEKDLNLKISLKLKSQLEEEGYDVFLTRDTDVFVQLGERSNLANILGADLFVSVHNNSGDKNKSYNGTTVLYNSSGYIPAEQLAENMRDNLCSALGTKKLPLQNRPNLAVLNSTYMPAVLAEVAVLTNSSDATKLKSDAFLNKVALSLSKSIGEFFGF